MRGIDRSGMAAEAAEWSARQYQCQIVRVDPLAQSEQCLVSHFETAVVLGAVEGAVESALLCVPEQWTLEYADPQ